MHRLGRIATASGPGGWAPLRVCGRAGFGATALAWSGHPPPSHRAIVAAIVALAATVAAIVASRVDADTAADRWPWDRRRPVFAAVAGFLVVPGGPAPPNFFLAAAICSPCRPCCSMPRPAEQHSSSRITAFSTTAAIAAAVAAIWPAPTATVGAVLAAASLAMLGVAAKLSILLTGLSPRMPSAADPARRREPCVADIGTARAERGHQMLTGLLAGFSVAAALGAVLVAAGHDAETRVSGVAFTAVVSAVLIFAAPPAARTGPSARSSWGGIGQHHSIFRTGWFVGTATCHLGQPDRRRPRGRRPVAAHMLISVRG